VINIKIEVLKIKAERRRLVWLATKGVEI